MSLEKTVTLTQEAFKKIPGYTASLGESYYRGQVMAMISELGAEEYGVSRGDIVFSLSIDVADGSHTLVKFRIRPVLIQVKTLRRGKAMELVPKPATSWYLLWKHLESKIAVIKVGIVDGFEELMSYMSLPDGKGGEISLGEAMKWMVSQNQHNSLALEYTNPEPKPEEEEKRAFVESSIEVDET